MIKSSHNSLKSTTPSHTISSWVPDRFDSKATGPIDSTKNSNRTNLPELLHPNAPQSLGRVEFENCIEVICWLGLALTDPVTGPCQLGCGQYGHTCCPQWSRKKFHMSQASSNITRPLPKSGKKKKKKKSKGSSGGRGSLTSHVT